MADHVTLASILLVLLQMTSLGHTQIVAFCECAMMLVEEGRVTNVYDQLPDASQSHNLTDCDAVESDCRVFCISQHNAWWTYFDLSTTDPETRNSYGTGMCREYGSQIDQQGAGYPLVTYFKAQECPQVATFTSTQVRGEQNLCCDFDLITGFLQYNDCRL